MFHVSIMNQVGSIPNFSGEDGSKEVGMQHVQSHHQWESQVKKQQQA